MLLLTRCYSDKPNRAREEWQHNFIETEDFKMLSRTDQVKKCGSCHQEIYENELKGPHANAFINLQNHMAFVNSDSYDCKEYCNYLNAKKAQCIDCHTGANLYETVFKGCSTEADFKRKIVTYILPESRKDTLGLITGVDCMTCHFDGKQVITMPGKLMSKSDSCPSFCSPTSRPLFASNYNCYTCHIEQVVVLEKYSKAHPDYNKTTCSSCHSERKENGRFTHYTYWAHNSDDRSLPDRLNLFLGINAHYSKAQNAIKIIWKNSLLPHPVSICTELVTAIQVTDGGVIIASDTIRLNRKENHLSQIKPFFDIAGKEVPGVFGGRFNTLNDSIIKMIKLPGHLNFKNLTVNVKGFKKEQYWLNDSINTPYLNKAFQLVIE